MAFKVAWFFAKSKNRDALKGQLVFFVMVFEVNPQDLTIRFDLV